MSDWDISSIISSVTNDISSSEDILQEFKDEMMKIMVHETSIASMGTVSKFIRSTEFSNAIAHNAQMSQCLQHVLDRRKMKLFIIFHSFS